MVTLTDINALVNSIRENSTIAARQMVADALDEAGRTEEAGYLRSPYRVEIKDVYYTPTRTYGPVVRLRNITRDRKLSKAVRAAAGESGMPYPIEVIDGFAAPELTGRSWYYTTSAGTLVRHPNAYKRVAKSAELVYHGSTHTIQVGAGWLIENGLV